MFRLVALAADQPTSYISGGRTRVNGEIPHISQLLLAGQLGTEEMQIAPRAGEDWAALQARWIDEGGEPIRVTGAFRNQSHKQRQLRQAYELWLAAGEPTPGGPGWRSGMSSAYAARPGTSNHGYGSAIDIDVRALYHPESGRGTNQTLSRLWDIAREFGWTPIIKHPIVSQSESWHFDHIGGMTHVYRAFKKASQEVSRKYAPATSHTAMVGCALLGQLPGQTPAHHVQALLSMAGHFCGLVDGDIGKLTKDALRAAGYPDLWREDPHTQVSILVESKIADDAMDKL